VVRPERAQLALETLREHPLGREAAILGTVDAQSDGLCVLHTVVGGQRVVQKPYGEMLPRIC
jgi:hydrogenase expression/formation protein HypE